MRITKERANRHCDRQDLAKDNCKQLKGNPNRKKVKAGWDAFAVKEEFRTLKLTGDGSSRPFEWISNLNVKAREGFHRGFYRAAVKGFNNLEDSLDHPLSFYDKMDDDGHSRGIFVWIIKLMVWAKIVGLEWNYKTGKGFFKAIKRYAENFDGDYSNWPKVNFYVGSGNPVFMTPEMKKVLEMFPKHPIESHWMVTEKDFVPKINAPEKGPFSRLLKKHKLCHPKGELYRLPTVSGVIDHLGYRAAIDAAMNDMWGIPE